MATRTSKPYSTLGYNCRTWANEAMRACGLCRDDGRRTPGRPPLYMCFVAGTPVATPGGKCNIERLEVGDPVFAYDVEKQELLMSPVSAVHEGVVKEICVLQVGADTIRTTSQHPFYVVGTGWSRAGELRCGSELLTRDGTRVQVGKVTRELERAVVYNVSVECQRNYFVGNVQVLVHNK